MSGRLARGWGEGGGNAAHLALKVRSRVLDRQAGASAELAGRATDPVLAEAQATAGEPAGYERDHPTADAAVVLAHARTAADSRAFRM